MSRCRWTRDYGGVVVGCKLPAGHDDPASGSGAYMHEVTCPTCAGMVSDVFPQPGIRCQEHGTPEPS